MGREDVAVFWDLDTCPIHRTISGYETVERIRLLSQKLGNVRSFRGYADLTGLGSFSGSLQLRSELQSSGISLIDCPTTEQKSIASKTMIVDMLTHAVDNPPPTTLLVIAGNNDFSYAVSILRLRRYDVVLVCPKDRVGRRSQASLYLDWFEDILGCSPPVVDDSPQFSGDTRHPRPGATSPDATTIPSRASPSQDRTTPSPVVPDNSNLPKHVPKSPIPNTSPDNSVHLQETIDDRNDASTPIVELIPPSPSMAPGISDAYSGKGMERMCTVTQSRIPEMPLDIQRPSSAPPSYSSFSPAPSPSSEDLCTRIASQPFCTPGFIEDEPFNKSMGTGIDSFGHVISQAQSLADTSTNTITPRDFVAGESSHTLPRPTAPSTERIATQPTQIIAPSQMVQPTPPGRDTSSLPGLLTPTVSPPIPIPSTTFHPPAPDVVPGHFMPLVRILQLRRAQGQAQVFRPSVAAEIVSSHRDEMEEVEASTFLQYARLAERAGIVELSLPADKPWISLRPELYEYPLD